MAIVWLSQLPCFSKCKLHGRATYNRAIILPRRLVNRVNGICRCGNCVALRNKIVTFGFRQRTHCLDGQSHCKCVWMIIKMHLKQSTTTWFSNGLRISPMKVVKYEEMFANKHKLLQYSVITKVSGITYPCKTHTFYEKRV